MFLGAVAQGDVAELLAAADVAVVPSVRDDAGTVDGLPNLLLEARASGTPVVATAAGGMGAVAVDGETARVVPQRSREALAAAIEELLQRPEYGAQLGRQARSEMCRTHSWARVAERFEQTYARATEQSPVSR